MLIHEECMTVATVGHDQWAPFTSRCGELSTTDVARHGPRMSAVDDDDLEEFDEDDFDDDFDDDFEDEDDDLAFDDDDDGDDDFDDG